MYSRNSYKGIDPFIVSTANRKAKSLIQYHCFSESDLEELQQELLIAALMSLNQYDPGKSAFRTYISRVIDNKATDLIRHRLSKYQAELALSNNLELTFDSISEADDPFRASAADIINQLELSVDIERICNSLPNELADLCKLLQVMNITEIIQYTGLSRSTIHRQLKKIKMILMKYDFDDCF
ncbi:MAG: hypothetical protein Tsb006_5080 [Rickettsiaceae bacterium]